MKKIWQLHTLLPQTNQDASVGPAAVAIVTADTADVCDFRFHSSRGETDRFTRLKVQSAIGASQPWTSPEVSMRRESVKRRDLSPPK
ncbi:MAG: hypothetical protein IPH75_11205 [bacterium]|nr:hypothetical protein [bacterium]